MFAKDTYLNRRNTLISRVSKGLILLVGNDESSINFADNWYHFRQDSTFLYYVGISRPGLCATIDAESGETILYGDDLTIDDIVWTGSQPTIRELGALSGILSTGTLVKLGTTLRQADRSGRAIHLLPPYRVAHSQKLEAFLGWSDEQIQASISLELIQAVAAQRNIKSAEELEEINRAVNITGQMHLAAMTAAKPGMKEYELVSKVQAMATYHGGELAFPIILTKNGQTLHNHYHGNTIQKGDMILCDAGAETSMGYCGDMTRTFPVDTRFTSQQAEIYEVVLGAHNTAVASLRPGLAFRDIHLKACQALFEGLKNIGLTKGDPEEAVSEGAHTMFFQCGLGHLMGLDVHDMENLGEQNVGYTPQMLKSKEFGLKSLRLGRQLEPGFVLTVEPGIYFIPQLIDLWKADNKYAEFINYELLKKYRTFGGIRIEENFTITPQGATLLGDPIPKSITEMEALRH